MKNQSSITALMSAFGRAFHAEHEPNPIFADHKAKELMTDEEYISIGKYILGGMDFFAPDQKGTFESEAEALRYLVYTQIAPTPVARARFCEDRLATAMQTGTMQYVILGAGMDTFALRKTDFMKKYKVFEVDHPQTQSDKLERIKRANFKIPDQLSYVPIDFSKDDLKEGLLKAGFDPKQKTFFSWLGVSYYLTKTEIETMLETVSSLSAEGSSLVFDYADENLFSSSVRRVQNMIAMANAGGEPMQSCFESAELKRILEKHGFLIHELMTSQEIQAQYFKGHASKMTAFEHIHYVHAVRK